MEKQATGGYVRIEHSHNYRLLRWEKFRVTGCTYETRRANCGDGRNVNANCNPCNSVSGCIRIASRENPTKSDKKTCSNDNIHHRCRSVSNQVLHSMSWPNGLQRRHHAA